MVTVGLSIAVTLGVLATAVGYVPSSGLNCILKCILLEYLGVKTNISPVIAAVFEDATPLLILFLNKRVQVPKVEENTRKVA